MPNVFDMYGSDELGTCKAVIDGEVCGKESCATVHMINTGHDFQEHEPLPEAGIFDGQPEGEVWYDNFFVPPFE